jgi:hypothetical protein
MAQFQNMSSSSLRKAFLALLFTTGLATPALSAGWLPLAASSGCTPVTYAGGPFYQSLAFTDSWSPAAAALTTNNQASPACTTTGALLVENSPTSTHYLAKTVTATISAAPHTLTIYAGQVTGTRNFEPIVFASGYASYVDMDVALSTCTISAAATVSGSFTSPSGTASVGPSGYCKITMTYTSISDTAINLELFMLSGTTSSYAGDGVSSLKLWGLDYR